MFSLISLTATGGHEERGAGESSPKVKPHGLETKQFAESSDGAFQEGVSMSSIREKLSHLEDRIQKISDDRNCKVLEGKIDF